MTRSAISVRRTRASARRRAGAATRSLLRGLLPVEVADLVGAAEVRAQPAAARQPLADADLVRVGVDDDVRAPVAGDGEERRALAAAVDDLVRALLPQREAQRLALLELALAVRRAQRRP